jgi:hypothetical protein
MTIKNIEYKNAQQLENGGFDCEVNHPEFSWIPYTVNLEDIDNSVVDSIELHQRITEEASFEAYTPPTAEELLELKAEEVRSTRNKLLHNVVDPISTNILRWSDLTETEKAEIATYRTELLDITEQASFPEVTWPTQPEVLDNE